MKLLRSDNPDVLLPLIPFDMGGWTAYLTPSHPFVRDRPDAIEALKLYNKRATR